jgi:predicted metal-binding transcription factor (methanogenesis marker protein 9)
MKKIIVAIFINLFWWFFLINPAWSLSGQNVVELKKAGVSDQTIQVITQEKVIETAAFSIDDIVAMKKAGVGEETLREIIKDGSFLKNSEPVVYGRSTQSVRNISPEEVINLKKNGVSDEVIQSVIEASKSDDQQDRERAWQMLENMSLRIDTRNRH